MYTYLNIVNFQKIIFKKNYFFLFNIFIFFFFLKKFYYIFLFKKKKFYLFNILKASHNNKMHKDQYFKKKSFLKILLLKKDTNILFLRKLTIKILYIYLTYLLNNKNTFWSLITLQIKKKFFLILKCSLHPSPSYLFCSYMLTLLLFIYILISIRILLFFINMTCLRLTI